MQIQAVNNWGSLLFVGFVLTTLVMAGLMVYRKLRRRRIRSFAIAALACLSVYAAILLVVSFASQTHQIALGTDKCFDDWCATVTGARSLPNANGDAGGKRVAVTLRVTNRARGAAFRPSQPRVMLALPLGKGVTPSAAAQEEFEKQFGSQQNLAKRIVAGETFQTTVVFTVPSATREASVVLLEGPAIVTAILVGDENSLFHKKVVFSITIE